MKKNLPLIVGIALPIFFIIVMALVLYVPSALVNPAHDFVYSTPPSDYNAHFKNDYKLVDGKVVTDSVVAGPLPSGSVLENAPRLYVYSVAADTTREVTLAEAQKLVLEPGPSSPDGYTLDFKYSNDGIFGLFGSNSSQSGYYLSKGRGSKKLVGLGMNDRYYYRGDIRLIGWVK